MVRLWYATTPHNQLVVEQDGEIYGVKLDFGMPFATERERLSTLPGLKAVIDRAVKSKRFPEGCLPCPLYVYPHYLGEAYDWLRDLSIRSSETHEIISQRSTGRVLRTINGDMRSMQSYYKACLWVLEQGEKILKGA